MQLRGVNIQTLDYIRSTNGAFIDPVVPSWTSYTVEVDYMKVTTRNGVSLFGCSDDNTKWSGVPYFNASTTFYVALGTSNVVHLSITLNQRRTFALTVDKSGGTWRTDNNGATASGTFSGTLSDNYNIYLLCHNVGSYCYQFSDTMLYGARITVDGTLIRDFVPAMDADTGVIGLNDTLGSICPLTGTTLYPAANLFTYGQIIT